MCFGADGGGLRRRRTPGRDALWYAVKETLEVQVEGKSVRGSATFTENFGGSGKSADGSFEVNCG